MENSENGNNHYVYCILTRILPISELSFLVFFFLVGKMKYENSFVSDNNYYFLSFRYVSWLNADQDWCNYLLLINWIRYLLTCVRPWYVSQMLLCYRTARMGDPPRKIISLWKIGIRGKWNYTFVNRSNGSTAERAMLMGR